MRFIGNYDQFRKFLIAVKELVSKFELEMVRLFPDNHFVIQVIDSFKESIFNIEKEGRMAYIAIYRLN